MHYSKPADIDTLNMNGEKHRSRGGRRRGSSSRASCLKVPVMITNFLFMLGGMGLLGAGIYALMAPHFLISMLGSHLLRVLGILFIVTGSLVFVFSLFGCVGAKLEHKCLLVLYLILIFLVCVSLVTCLIVLIANEEEVKQAGASLIRRTLMQHYGFNTTLSALVDRVQSDLRCCGVWTGKATLYRQVRWFYSQPADATRISLPDSCCRRNSAGRFLDKKRCQSLPPTPLENKFFYNQGCMNALWGLWRTYRGYIVGSGAGVLVILLLLFVTTLIFTCQIRDRHPHGGIHV